MMDRRETILARLETILAAVDGVESVSRNRDVLPDAARPAAVLLDGDESARGNPATRNAPANAPTLVTMTPEIFIVLESKLPSDGENRGSRLNGFRTAILSAVMNDPEIIATIGARGRIGYVGAQSDMARGRPMVGEMGLTMQITYTLRPSELEA